MMWARRHNEHSEYPISRIVFAYLRLSYTNHQRTHNHSLLMAISFTISFTIPRQTL